MGFSERGLAERCLSAVPNRQDEFASHLRGGLHLGGCWPLGGALGECQ